MTIFYANSSFVRLEGFINILVFQRILGDC